jgi:hypothetical protein
MKNKRLDDEQDNALAQMKKDLAAAKALASRTMAESSLPGPFATGSKSINNSAQPAPSTSRHQPTSPLGQAVRNRKKALQDHLNTCLAYNVSASRTEWQRQKDQENASNLATVLTRSWK